MKNRKSKNILLVGLGNLGSNYIRAIKSLSYRTNLYIHDKNFKALDKNYDYPKNINLIKIRNIKNFNQNLDLAILATTAKRRLNLIRILKKNKIKFWILEKLLEQNVSSTNKVYECLKLDKCWVNIPRRALPEYMRIKKNFKNHDKIDLKLSMNGDRIVTNAIHFIDLVSWFTNSKVSKVDTSKLKNEWVESKRKGFFEVGGVLKVFLRNNSRIILKAGKKIKKSDMVIGNKLLSWTISERNLYAYRSDGIKIKVKPPLVSELMKKIIKDIFKNKNCSLPVLEDVVENHNALISSLKKHWIENKYKNVKKLPVT